MYLDYYGFKEFPFSLVADPRFLYLSEDHSRVKSYIDYAMNIQDSFVVCTGEIGSGKTTLINDALKSRDSRSVVARIQATNFNEQEFMQLLLLEFGIEPYSFSKVQMMEKIKQFLQTQHSAGKKVFLFVDEAQILDKTVLENIRYMADMEKNQRKLMSVILVGQPELNETLDQPDMEHLLQRVRLRFHIKALGVEDVDKYIKHRMSVAGIKNNELFDINCIPMIHQFTGGRVRLVNTLCDYALMYCYVENLPKVTEWVIQNAANELQWESYEKRFGHTGEATNFKMDVPPKPPQLSAKLRISHKEQEIGLFRLDKDCVTIGRQIDNDIPIDDHKVSRNHAQIVIQGNLAYLHDLNSTNGTFVEKRKVNVHQLMDGDSFSVGDFNFIFHELKNETHQFKKEETRLRPKQPSLSLVDN